VSATITLPGHPHCGEKVSIIASFGPDMVRVELADGRLRLLPVRWTSLCPAWVSEWRGRQVRFPVESLRALAKWVSARVTGSGSNRQKLGHFDKRPHKVAPDDALREGIGRTGVHGARGRGGTSDGSGSSATDAVVEQACAPSTDGGSRCPRAPRRRR
jgi:hypothetical protein